MDPNFLLKDELEYELECREIKLKKTAPVLRQVLRELLIEEQAEDPPRELKCPYQSAHSIAFELEVCSAKLKVLANYVSEIEGKPDRTLFRRLISRLYHVENRLTLLRHDTEAHGINRDSLKEQCRQLINNLELKDNVEEDGSLTEGDKKVLEETLGDLGVRIIQKLEIKPEGLRVSNSGQTARTANKEHENKSVSFVSGQWDEGRVNTPMLARSSTIDDEFPKRKLVPIYQWGLKFTGTGEISINAFLERVDELKEARNATETDLFRYAIDFFDGDALIWYRANKEYAKNWAELVILMKRSFQKPFYQEELLSEIKARTQGMNESVLIYISIMQNMFKRLPNRLSENDKIQIILRNLQPYYQRAICRDEFYSVPDMINVLRVIERTKITCDNFQEPRPSKASLEPDLAYKAAVPPPSADNIEIGEVTGVCGPVLPSRRCWNCRESGHVFRDCSLPKQRLFCYKCGRFGLTTKDCKCTGNGEGGSSNAAN